MLPTHILGIWLRGLLAVAILMLGAWLLKRWYEESRMVVDQVRVEAVPATPGTRDTNPGSAVALPARREFRFDPGWNRPTADLAAAVALLTWGLAGRRPGRAVSSRLGGPRPAPDPADEPRPERTGEVHRIKRPDGSELQVESYGPPDAPPIVWVHGWGADSTEWFYPKKSLSNRFRLIVWDEPGLGLSRAPDNDDYSLEKLAADLDAVLALAGDRRALLVGHSIGGMILLTFCRAFPQALQRRVAGLVLAHTTYTNPVRTTRNAALHTALEKPVIVPLCRLMIALWPLVRAMMWLSYLNGSAHRSTHREGFSGGETRGQLDYFARYQAVDRPDVLARGMLGMLAYDATHTLPAVPVPTLVVAADRDITTLPEASQHMARTIPDARLVTLAPARHLGLIEHHARFDALVAEFAESCLETDPARPPGK